MRILITGTTYPPCFNGQSIFTGHLAEGMAKKGHHVRALFPSHLIKPFLTNVSGVECQGIRAFDVGFHVDVYYSLFPQTAIHSAFSDFKPDIVHIHDHFPLSAMIANEARKKGLKVVGTNHFLPENWAPYFPWSILPPRFSEKVLWAWVRSIYDRLDMVTSPSKTAAGIIKSIGLKAPVTPISCGVDLNTFNTHYREQRQQIRQMYGLPLDKPVMAFVGRLDGEKKLDVILKAIQLSGCDQLHILVVGKGAAQEEIKKLVADLGLTGRAHFPGFIASEDLPKALNAVDIFTMPSEAELLSIATLEAMGCGLPVLAANSRALPELVDQEVNGYLFTPSDPQDAASYIRKFIQSPARWPEMGEASLKKVQPHSIENTYNQYEKIYLDLLAK